MTVRIALVLLTSIVSAAALADPMRPFTPPAAAAAASGAPVAPVAPRNASTTTATEAARPPLHAIRIDADGRRQALIGEQWYAAGARVNEQLRVLAIEGNRVDIQHGKSRSSLHLLPPLVSSTPTPSPLTRATALATPGSAP
jgi:hypothetical protein